MRSISWDAGGSGGGAFAVSKPRIFVDRPFLRATRSHGKMNGVGNPSYRKCPGQQPNARCTQTSGCNVLPKATPRANRYAEQIRHPANRLKNLNNSYLRSVRLGSKVNNLQPTDRLFPLPPRLSISSRRDDISFDCQILGERSLTRSLSLPLSHSIFRKWNFNARRVVERFVSVRNRHKLAIYYNYRVTLSSRESIYSEQSYSGMTDDDENLESSYSRRRLKPALGVRIR